MRKPEYMHLRVQISYSMRRYPEGRRRTWILGNGQPLTIEARMRRFNKSSAPRYGKG